jgi:hypothetical protein
MLADGVEVGGTAGGSAVSVAGSVVAVAGGAVSSGGIGVPLGTGVDLGETVGGGAQAPRSVETVNRTTGNTATRTILFTAATLLIP